MRLICPNCDAQYEVADSIIPDEGRDVQCSSCGQTWFQKSAKALIEEELAENDIDVASDASDLAPEPESEPAPEPEHTQEPRRPDSAALDILREEAEREREARRTQMEGGIETQPDLGLDQAEPEPAPQKPVVHERTARLRGIESELDKPATRSDMLPDVEEINSTLRATTEREAQDLDDDETIVAPPTKRGKFRFGFLLVVFIAALMAAVYIFAPQIVEKLPQTEAYMTRYVDFVNVMRAELEQLIKAATDKISSWNDS